MTQSLWLLVRQHCGAESWEARSDGAGAQRRQVYSMDPRRWRSSAHPGGDGICTPRHWEFGSTWAGMTGNLFKYRICAKLVCCSTCRSSPASGAAACWLARWRWQWHCMLCSYLGLQKWTWRLTSWGPDRPKKVVLSLFTPDFCTSPTMRSKYESLVWMDTLSGMPGVAKVVMQAI